MLLPFTRQDTVTVELDTNVVFLPNMKTDSPSHARDLLLHGVLKLRAPHRRRPSLSSSYFQVVLERLDYTSAPGKSDPTRTLVAEDIVIISPDMANFGEFTLKVSPTSAQTSETRHGSTVYRVSAIELSPSASKPLKSAAVPVNLVLEPELDFGVPATTANFFGATAEGLGDISGELTSNFLTVGSLATVGVRIIPWPSPTPPGELVSINAFILQSISFPVKTNAKLTMVTEQFPLVTLLERGTPSTLSAGSSFDQRMLCRLPTDTKLCASTRKSSETDARMTVAHKLVIRVAFRRAGSIAEESYIVSRSIHIASCLCVKDGFQLPIYVADEPTPARHEACACSSTFMELVAESGIFSSRTTPELAAPPATFPLKLRRGEESLAGSAVSTTA